jgi:hypothetical protein
VSTEDGSLQWVARAGYVERPKSGSVRGSGCNSPDLLGSVAGKVSLNDWVDAHRVKDADRVVSHYAQDDVQFIYPTWDGKY